MGSSLDTTRRRRSNASGAGLAESRASRRVLPDGTQEWCNDGLLHREDGPAKEYPDGTRVWCRRGRRHREDGAAVEFADGTKIWCIRGKPHRLDGPAVERPTGQKEWWLHGEEVTEQVVGEAWRENMLREAVAGTIERVAF